MLFELWFLFGFTIGIVLGQIACGYCTCCKDSVCPNSGNKSCTRGCLHGYTGDTCQYKCPDNCISCDQHNAYNCYDCKDGYYNAWLSRIQWIGGCSLRCPDNCFSCKSYTYCSSCRDGFYNGISNFKRYDNCSLSCYPGCKACTSYGTCTVCKDGFYGHNLIQSDCSDECYHQCKTCTSYDVCNECNNRFYGLSCQHNCSIGCRYNLCNKDNGHCKHGCQVGFVGDHCDSCSDGFYYISGICSNCSDKCAVCFEDRLCNKCKENYGGIACQTACPQNCRSCVSDQECSECVNGYFGQTCKDSCPANCLDSTCNIHTGLCLACTEGFSGIKCNALCSDSCSNRNCYTNGSCVSCQPGAYGALCDNRCPNNCISCTLPTQCTSCATGYYGDTCEKECSNCLEGTSCSKYNGVCDTGCKDGWYNSDCLQSCDQHCKACERYYSSRCTTCADGRYGKGSWPYFTCDSFCPQTCLNNRCDYSTGQCTDGCVKGSWGSNCSKTCPVNCLNGECYQNNGSCIKGCIEGYEGNVCDCSTNCECDAVGICSRCKMGFTNVIKKCTCRKDICLEESCSRCSNNSFYSENNACCPCSSNCKDDVCVSALNCSLGCKPGYYGNDCAKICSDLDQWCEECPINYGQTNRGCQQCKRGYYPFKDVSYGYNRCKECPDTCLDRECDSTNGECIKGCVDKKWGLTCQEDCPINCLKCNRSSGSCTVCKGGKYLADCSQSCSASCNKTLGQLFCAIDDGACRNGCISFNIYGAHCDNNCSNNCKETACSWLTGECVKGCQINHWGKQCEHVCSENCKPNEEATSCNESTGQCQAGCIHGHYSVQCDKKCSINCLNTSCDISGKCIHGCSDKFVDDSCLQAKYNSAEKSNGDVATIGGSVGGALALTIIVIVAAIVLFKRRQRNEQNIEGNHGHNAVVYSNMVNRLQNSDTETSDAARISTAYEMIARRGESAEYSALSCDTHQSAAFLDVGLTSSEQVATEKIQTIYEKHMLEEDMREYSALEYDTRQTSDEYSYGHKDKIQNQSLTFGKGTERSDSVDNKTNKGACSFDEKTRVVREEEHTDYINTSLAGVSHAKKYS